MSFIHLHTSSAFSLKYGTTQPQDLVQRAAEFESPALALTDRDGLSDQFALPVPVCSTESHQLSELI